MGDIFYLAKIGELNLKKGNLKDFENRLAQNFRNYFTDIIPRVSVRAGRMYIQADESLCEKIEEELSVLLGITGWAQAKTAPKNIDDIIAAVLNEAKILQKEGNRTFKIEARRSDKQFPLTSYDIARETGGAVHDAGILSVDVHTPDVLIRVEVREKYAFIYGKEQKGCRGLPCGCSGRGLLLLSGGIDSPVAGYKMLFRGMKIDCIYFHSYPYTSEEAQQKVETLAARLARFGLGTYLSIIPFTKVQLHIKENAPEAYLTLLLRMCMMRVSSMLAQAVKARCLITGESLAQVASQTIENITVTESYADLPVLRPLIGTDKEDIIQCAQTIGTYETSILPYEDCCVLFSPKHPVLRAQKKEADALYQKMNIDALLQEAFEQRETKKISIYE